MQLSTVVPLTQNVHGEACMCCWIERLRSWCKLGPLQLLMAGQHPETHKQPLWCRHKSTVQHPVADYTEEP